MGTTDGKLSPVYIESIDFQLQHPTIDRPHWEVRPKTSAPLNPEPIGKSLYSIQIYVH